MTARSPRTAVLLGLLAICPAMADAQRGGGGLTIETEKLPPLSQGPKPGPDMQEAEIKAFDKTKGRELRRAFAGPVAGNEKILRESAEHYARRFTVDELEADLPDIADDIDTQLDLRAKQDVPAFLREAYANAYLPLLYHESPLVRTNIVLALSRLNERRGASLQDPPIPYWQVYRALLSVLEDEERKPAERLRASEGLRRIVQYSDIPRKDRDVVIKRAADVLDQLRETVPDGGKDDWYLLVRVAELLGDADAALTLLRQPRPVEALLALVNDERQHWWPRAAALRQISRLKLRDDPTFDVSGLAKLSVDFVRKMLAAYNEKPSEWYWRRAFAEVLLAFEPPTQQALDRGEGFLGTVANPTHRKHAEAVRAAYEAALPVFRAVSAMDPTQMKAVPDGPQKSLTEFAEANPFEGKIHPSIN